MKFYTDVILKKKHGVLFSSLISCIFLSNKSKREKKTMRTSKIIKKDAWLRHPSFSLEYTNNNNAFFTPIFTFFNITILRAIQMNQEANIEQSVTKFDSPKATDAFYFLFIFVLIFCHGFVLLLCTGVILDETIKTREKKLTLN